MRILPKAPLSLTYWLAVIAMVAGVPVWLMLLSLTPKPCKVSRLARMLADESLTATVATRAKADTVLALPAKTCVTAKL